MLHFQRYKIMENATLYIWDLFDTTNVIKSFISVDLLILNIVFIYIVNSFVLTLSFFKYSFFLFAYWIK